MTFLDRIIGKDQHGLKLVNLAFAAVGAMVPWMAVKVEREKRQQRKGFDR